ncbi:hypothetical protein V8F20_001944 [Naviculisporaceae sp. PSN 640]
MMTIKLCLFFFPINQSAALSISVSVTISCKRRVFFNPFFLSNALSRWYGITCILGRLFGFVLLLLFGFVTLSRWLGVMKDGEKFWGGRAQKTPDDRL